MSLVSHISRCKHHIGSYYTVIPMWNYEKKAGGKDRSGRFPSNGDEPSKIAKAGFTAKRVLLCVLWDYKEIIHYELLPSGQAVNSDLYRQQMIRLKQAIDRKRPELALRKLLCSIKVTQAAHIFNDASEAPRAWMGSSTATAV
ncbi:hypothetical protein RB195_010025 [Necator americanus]|uniref:Mariner Mos1 transposase n=1 Tax=Necator americanus TaxID=51031 RepID=A0ABR1CXW3_NECAM